jgi:Flp pilus assembly protein CpaB
MRAVPISIDDSTAVLSGMIKTGQFVDVYMTTDAGLGNRLQSTGGTDSSDRKGMTATLVQGCQSCRREPRQEA